MRRVSQRPTPSETRPPVRRPEKTRPRTAAARAATPCLLGGLDRRFARIRRRPARPWLRPRRDRPGFRSPRGRAGLPPSASAEVGLVSGTRAGGAWVQAARKTSSIFCSRPCHYPAGRQAGTASARSSRIWGGGSSVPSCGSGRQRRPEADETVIDLIRRETARLVAKHRFGIARQFARIRSRPRPFRRRSRRRYVRRRAACR